MFWSFPPPAILRPQTVTLSPVEGLVAPLAASWECDLADDSIRWSRGVFDLFGLDAAHRLDRRDTVAMYEEESRELLDRLRNAAIRNCNAFTFEAWIRRPTGERRLMRVTADVVVRGGRATHLYGTKRDITDGDAIA